MDFEIVSFDPPICPGFILFKQDYRTAWTACDESAVAQIKGILLSSKLNSYFIYLYGCTTYTHTKSSLSDQGLNQTF